MPWQSFELKLSLMTKALKIIAIIVGVLIILSTGAYLYFQNFLKHDLQPLIKRVIADETGIKIDFEDLDLSFTRLLEFKPTIVIKKLKVQEAFFIEKLHAELYLKEVLKKNLKIKNILIEKANLRFEENAKHEIYPLGIDLKKVQERIEAKQKEQKHKTATESLITEMELNELEINDSRFELTPYKAKSPIALTDFNLSLTDFYISESNKIKSKLNLKANLFGIKSSNVKCQAELGPTNIKLSTMPIAGDFSIDISIKDLPNDLKNQFLGPNIRANNNSSLKYSSTIKGDLFDKVIGSGNLKITNLSIGSTNENIFNADANVPVSYTMGMSVDNRNLYISSKNANLNLSSKKSGNAKLNLTTNLQVNMDNMYMSGNTAGNLTGLEIEEVLNSFTDVRRVVSGIFEAPNFKASFSGTDAKSISKTLIADGNITIKNGSLYILQNIIKYKDLADIVIQNGGALTEKISGQFGTLTTDFHVEKKLLTTDNLNLKTNIATITGNGSVKNSQWLVYDLILTSPKLSSPLPMKLRGTIEKPQIYPDMEAFVKMNKGKVVRTALQTGLNALQQQAAENTKLKNVLNKVQGNLNGSTVNGTVVQPTPKDALKNTLQGIARDALNKQIGKISKTKNGTSATSKTAEQGAAATTQSP